MHKNTIRKFMLLVMLFTLSLVAQRITLVSAQDDTSITYLSILAPDTGFSKIIGELAVECQSEVPNVTYELQNVGHDMLEQRLKQLAINNNLPTMFSNNAGAGLVELVDNGYVLNVKDTFTELGIYDKINPAAAALVSNVTQDIGVYALPLELNIEGFWYNKQLFADNNLNAPKTWDDMVAVAAVFQEKGIQPFAVAGKEGWPLTRLLVAYAVRKYGADAMIRVKNGELKVTDPGFVEAAQALKDLAKKGYLGVSPNTIDYGTALDQFLQGKAAMYFMGSWELRSFNDPEKALLGMDNIGFFNSPLVKDGVGTLDDFSINIGTVTSISKANYNETVGKWLKCVFSKYGDRAMTELGMITGFKVENPPKDLPSLTQFVLDQLDAAKNAYLPWESYFNPKASAVAGENVQLLISDDSYTAEQYMADLQKMLDEGS